MSGANGQAKVLSKKEFERTVKIAELSQHGLRNVALLYCSFYLGWRVKEMAVLKISDVANINLEIKELARLTASMTKGNDFREVYLGNKKIRESLKSYINYRKSRETQFFRIDAALFLSQAGGKFSPNALQQLFKKMFVDAGITGASSHSGRRTYCTRLIEQGVDIKAVSKLMGHNSIQMTAQYVQDNPESLKRIAEAVVI